jgi:hypothetical protein
VPQLAKARWVPPWIAMVLAYALAQELLLTGVAAAQMMTAHHAAVDGLFAICQSSGAGLAGDQDRTRKPQQPLAPCDLCTLTNATVAILPMLRVLSIIESRSLSDAVRWNDLQIRQHDSPTGRYQRGPPSSADLGG